MNSHGRQTLILRLRSLPRMAIAAIIGGAAAVFVIVGGLLTSSHLAAPQPNWQFSYISTRSGYPELYLTDIDHAAPRQLTDSNGSVQQAAWSPDGRYIAFVGGYESRDIYAIDADNPDAAFVNLTATAGIIEEAPVWSPDGRQIAFSAWNMDIGTSDIFVMDVSAQPDGSLSHSLPRQLTYSQTVDGLLVDVWDALPVWSPDGQYIAYISSNAAWDIWLTNLDGTAHWPLADTPFDEQWPVWSPDGSRMAFTSWEDGDAEIYVVDIAAGEDGQMRAWNRLQLTSNSFWEIYPAWSPDGSQIAFVSDRDGGTHELYLMNADGSHPRRMTYTDGTETTPQWSPDGRWLLYTMERRYTGRFAATGNCGLFAADAGRGLIRQLTGGLDGVCDSSPVWRP